MAGLEDVFDLGDTLFGDLRDVNEAVEVSLELNKGAEAGDFTDGTFDHLTDLEAALDQLPRIFGELFEAERDSLVGFVDAEDLSVDGIAFFDDFRGVGGFAGPRHIGDVDHTIDAFLQFDERAISGGIADNPFHRATDRVAQVDLFPWIGFEMADGERKFLLFLADADDDGFDLLAVLNDIAWTSDAAGPR